MARNEVPPSQCPPLTGCKASGLAKLPKAWVPGFAEIPTPIVDVIRSGASLSPGHKTSLEKIIDSLRPSRTGSELIARSNPVEDHIGLRGLLRSCRCDFTVEGVTKAITDVVAAPGQECDGVLLQVYQHPDLSGHLSNERRISRDRRSFLWEVADSGDGNVHAQKLRPKVKLRRGTTLKKLDCAAPRELRSRMQDLVRYLYDIRGRWLLEWVWSNGTLWVVQMDSSPILSGGVDPTVVTESTTHILDTSLLRYLRRPSASDFATWQKLTCASKFEEAGLPTAPLFVLSGASVVADLARGVAPASLRDDLQLLARSRFVIRSDLAGSESLMAYRSDTIQSVDAAISRLCQFSKQHLASAKPEDVCFILHNFLPARACAFSYTKIGHSRVLIDALWGLPDGLQFYPHDSYEVEGSGQSILAQRLRFKPHFLREEADGNWQRQTVAQPYDWKPTLTKAEIRTIATGAIKLSSVVQGDCCTMWFVGCRVNEHDTSTIPWRYTTNTVPERVGSLVGIRGRRRVHTVASQDDIDRVVAGGIKGQPLLVSPFEQGSIRSESFLKEVARVAKEHGVPVHLEGSMLQHAFFLLQREGAHVLCSDLIEGKSKTRHFEKLVRDSMPRKIERGGETVHIIQKGRQGQDYEWMLRQKLIEEALEAAGAHATEPTIDELGDVYEVMAALAGALGSNIDAIARRASDKRQKLGGFDKGIVLKSTEDEPLVLIDRAGTLFPVRKRTIDHALNQAMVRGSRAKTRFDRLILSLIPPVRDMHRGPIRLLMPSLDLVLEVDYGEKTVEIVVRKTRPQENDRQLTFPWPSVDQSP